VSLTLLHVHALRRAWTDPVSAASRDPDVALQGEYLLDGDLLQAGALGGGQFHVARISGGRPGSGAVTHARLSRHDVRALARRATRHTRTSPTLGAAPPAGALVLHPLGGPDAYDRRWSSWSLDRAGLLREGAVTRAEFGDVALHLEFLVPYKPYLSLGSQDRGNSGVYLADQYEIQILDSFALHADAQCGFASTRWCAAVYGVRAPDVSPGLPPLTWQTYDIEFRAARFVDGQKMANARVTVRFNGVMVHNDIVLEAPTGLAIWRGEASRGPIVLQDHANPVRFRNIWAFECSSRHSRRADDADPRRRSRATPGTSGNRPRP